MSAVPWNELWFWGICPVCSFWVLAFNSFLSLKYVGGIGCQNFHCIWCVISPLYFSGRNIRPQNDYVHNGKECITAFFNVSCGSSWKGKILLSPFLLLGFQWDFSTPPWGSYQPRTLILSRTLVLAQYPLDKPKQNSGYEYIPKLQKNSNPGLDANKKPWHLYTT